MQFNITGKHLDITPAMHHIIEMMLTDITKNFNNITSAQVTLHTEKHQKIAEATLAVTGSPNIHGEASDDDMYIAIDHLKSKLISQLQKLKSKSESH